MDINTKWIFITGGVSSSLGKGVSGASIGKLLKLNGFSITMAKFDPYFNVDPGTMNPYQHGEVFVASDGAETDLDLGYYERFLGIKTTKDNTNTSGDIYKTVIEKEMAGFYKGGTVQVIPHITDEIQRRIDKFNNKVDVAIIEIGGTVGDIEGLPFIEAIRQFMINKGRKNVLHVHLTLVPYITAAGELKTKPTQHSVGKLQELGITPDIIICRAERDIDDNIKKKISLFCNVRPEAVMVAGDYPSIYLLVEAFYKQEIDKLIIKKLNLKARKEIDVSFFDIPKRELKKEVKVAVIGKYTGLKDAYKSISEALYISGLHLGLKVKDVYFDSEDENLLDKIKDFHGILIPGGYGYRGVEGKICAIKYARENNIPFFGICLGMQCAVIEAARNLAGIVGATSAEFNVDAQNKVIDMIESQKSIKDKGGSQRLGEYKAKIKKNSLAYKLYKKEEIIERHRHRYEFNPEYVEALEKAGLEVSAYHENLPEIVEIKGHPFFIGCQFHPEFNLSIDNPHPIFVGFLEACGGKG